MNERPYIEEDPGRMERLAYMDQVYKIFPELGSTLNRALTQGTGEEARTLLDSVSGIGRNETQGSYKQFYFDNPQNGRKFALKVFEKAKEGNQFMKDTARFSFTVSYVVADFEK